MVQKVNIVSVCVLYVTFTQVYMYCKVFRWVGGPESENSVCPHPLRRFTQGSHKVYARFMQDLCKVYAGIRGWDRTRSLTISQLYQLKKFSGGWWVVVVVHKVIIVSACVLG